MQRQLLRGAQGAQQPGSQSLEPVRVERELLPPGLRLEQSPGQVGRIVCRHVPQSQVPQTAEQASGKDSELVWVQEELRQVNQFSKHVLIDVLQLVAVQKQLLQQQHLAHQRGRQVRDPVAQQPQGFKFDQVVEGARGGGGHGAVGQHHALQDRHAAKAVVPKGARAHSEEQDMREVGGQAKLGGAGHGVPGALHGVPQHSLAGRGRGRGTAGRAGVPAPRTAGAPQHVCKGDGGTSAGDTQGLALGFEPWNRAEAGVFRPDCH